MTSTLNHADDSNLIDFKSHRRPLSTDSDFTLPGLQFDAVVASVSGPVDEDKRESYRHQFESAIVLAPIDSDHQEVLGSPVIIQGRDISETGVSFFHNVPLISKHFVAGFRGVDEKIHSVALHIVWSMRRDDGRWYSGACFDERLPVSAAGVSIDSSSYDTA